MVFVGYNLISTRYMLYDPVRKAVCLSRDVIFDEQILSTPTDSPSILGDPPTLHESSTAPASSAIAPLRYLPYLRPLPRSLYLLLHRILAPPTSKNARFVSPDGCWIPSAPQVLETTTLSTPLVLMVPIARIDMSLPSLLIHYR